ncbi:MAG TPA: hypothetical protein VFU43_30055 [Streptosporangiaceae bacterium]|nr:hypothetical protein [Streptosporangiaceae bacterium]
MRSAFARELARLLAGVDAAELAGTSGLPESIVREMSAGKSRGLSAWEVVSTCAMAAEPPREAMFQLRELWAKAESAEWAERGPELLREIERQALRARRQRPYDEKALSRRLFEKYRPSAPWRKTLGSGHSHGPWRFEPWSSAQVLNKQKIPDPDRAMSLSEFYELLRQLHQWAGRPSLAEIEQRSWGALSRTTAGYVLGAARALQPHVRDHDYVRYLATVFGLPPSEVERWINAYIRVRELPPNPLPGLVERETILQGTPESSSPGPPPAAEEPPGPPSPEAPQVTPARPLRWRVMALCFAASTAALGMALALTVTADDPPATHILQFPERPRLLPGKPIRIPLKLPAGDWSLHLHFRLESTVVASPCVHDAQLTYVVEKANGVDIASGRTTQGKPDSTAPAIRLDGSVGPPYVVISVSVPSHDIGCGYTIDLSGSTIRPR